VALTNFVGYEQHLGFLAERHDAINSLDGITIHFEDVTMPQLIAAGRFLLFRGN